MRIGVIGFGSIGKRHYENSLSLGYTTEVESLHTNTRLTHKNYDLIVVASKTDKHHKDILRFKNLSDTFLIEKPLAKSVLDAKKIRKSLKGKSALIGYTLMFNPIIIELKKILSKAPLGKINQIQIHCGSYLPEWRTGDYSKKYSAKKKEGGGVLRELIHELNYAQFLFPGIIKKIRGYSTKLSRLNVDCEDSSLIIFDQKDKNIIITLNYFQRLPERYIKIHAEKGTIICDLINKSIKILDQQNKVLEDRKFDFERNDTFISELQFAVSIAQKKQKIPSILSLDQGIKDLDIIEKIEKNKI